jgi:pyruvate-formate lyase-activating enzyme
MTMRVVAIYRSATYSPGRHRSNDAAIMDATTACLADRGWSVERLGEGDVEAGIIPDADLYLNMCQGPNASARLLDLEASGARMLNRPSSVLGCHRHHLVPALEASGLNFPTTVILPTTDAPLSATDLPDGEVWVKRGDVHAQQSSDVVRTTREGLSEALRTFAGRGVRRVAVQAHVPGPVLKFYGVGDGSFFHAFREDGRPVDGDTVDITALRRLAFAAARVIGVRVFGGDAVVASRTAPVLVDLNDWPSFAPVREHAAMAIARLAGAAIMQRSTR